MKRNTKIAAGLAIQARLPAGLEGEPGVGKTSFFNSCGVQFGLKVYSIFGSCRSPEDIGGYPLPNKEGTAISLVPAGLWQKELMDLGKGLLVIDELTTCSGSMQAALMALIHEGRSGDIHFPKEVVRVAIYNPADQAAGGFDLAAPLANRLIHIPWSADAETVIEGFQNGWAEAALPKLPSNWEEFKRPAASLIASFLRKFPQLVQDFPKEESKRSEAWPSPRSWWEFAIPSLAAVEATKLNDDILSILLCGSVGMGATETFLNWRRELDLPDPEELLGDWKKFEIADRHDKVFATLSAVVCAAVDKLTPDRWIAAWSILNKVALAGHVALAASACRTLAKSRTSKMPNVTELIKPFKPLLEAAGL